MVRIFLASAGIGNGFSYAPFMVTLVDYFPMTFATANSIVVTGAAIGMMVLPPLSELLISIYGWRWALALLAALNFNVTAFGSWVRRPISSYESLHSDENPATYGAQNPNCEQNWIRKRVVAFLKQLLGTLSLDIFVLAPSYSMYLIAWFVNGMVYSSWLLYLIPHAVSRGIGSQQASFLATVGGLGNLVVRLIHGPAIDHGLVTASGLLILLSLIDAMAFFLDTVAGNDFVVLVLLATINGATLGTIGILAMPVAQDVLSGDLFLKGFYLTLPFFAFGEAFGGGFAGTFMVSAFCLIYQSDLLRFKTGVPVYVLLQIIISLRNM